MAGTNLGSAYVQIVPSADGIKGSIQKILNGEAGDAGDKAGKTMMGKLKGWIVKAGIGAALWKSMNLGAELEQNLGGSEAVFGEYAESLQNTAKEAYKNMGLSQSEYLATANKMGSLFQGSGIDQAKSLEMTTEAMKRAADVASVMGIDQQQAMESIAGAAKGNFTMMDNLGVAMNATTLKAYALEKGVNFDWDTASNAEKAELAMQMFMDRTAQYEGNFAKESEQTFSGSLEAMKASVKDFVANLTLGQNVSESLSNVLTSVGTFVFGNMIPMVGTILKALPPAIITFLKQGVPMILSNVQNLISSLATGITGFAEGISSEKVSEWAKNTLPGLLNSAKMLIGGFAKGLLGNIGTILKAIGRIGLEIVKGLGSALWGKVTAAAAGVRDRFMQPIYNLRDRIKAIIDKIKGFFSFHVSAPKIPMPHFSISPSGWKLGDLLKGSIPSLGISWYAKGGIFDQPSVIGVGEAGSEAVLPLDRLSEYMPGIDYDRLAAAMVKALSKVDMISTVEIDGREVARSTAPYLQTELDVRQQRSNRKLGYVL